MPQIDIILNPTVGDGREGNLAQRLKTLFRDHDMTAYIRETQKGEDTSKLVLDCQNKTIVAAGGDGTVSAVAGALAETDKSLGVLPLGTLNHFAKDLKIPLDINEAIETVTSGQTIRVDAAEVNGHLFINNSSFGLYPEVVHGRELHERLGHGKWNSLLRSAIRVFQRYPVFVVRIDSNDERIVTSTPFVFIGNNEYEIEGLNIGKRQALNKGKLAVYTTRRTGRLSLFRIAIRALFGRLRQEKDFVNFLTDEVTIETPRRLVRVAMDGEVAMLETPLRYRIVPDALRVIVPNAKPNKEAD